MAGIILGRMALLSPEWGPWLPLELHLTRYDRDNEGYGRPIHPYWSRINDPTVFESVRAGPELADLLRVSTTYCVDVGFRGSRLWRYRS